jgi:hypothetical protein
MNRDVLAKLLEAEPDELRGIGETETAQRVRADEEVRLAAAAILRQTDALDRGLLASHAGAHVNAQAAPTPAYAMPLRRGRARHARSLAVASLAAAALLTLLLTRPASNPLTESRPSGRSLTARLDVSADRPFAVIATDNPDIAIVWLFNQED